MDQATIESLPEKRRNALLRRRDWRFLLRHEDAPAPGRPLEIGFPGRRRLPAAVRSLPEGGELLCSWRIPRLWGVQRARRRLERAGFADPRMLWPGPLPHRHPQFWLPPDSPAALAHLLSSRPAGSPAQAALRALWRAAARLGLLAPVFVLARAPERDGGGSGDALTPHLPSGAPCLLLTGGDRSINKVVALPFPAGSSRPDTVVKFSRVPESDLALEREANALSAVAQTHPQLEGVPRLLARGRRGGGHALAESAIYGRPLIAELSEQSFGDLAGRVTRWLIELARDGAPATGDWRERLLDGPLAEFERNFGGAAPRGTVAAAQAQLAQLDGLPQVCEHRDCSPWNVVLTADGSPALLDWESAEPCGLPGLDLAYFLANSAFVIDGALDSGRTRESYARLLDADHPHGAIATRCAAEYCAALGIPMKAFAQLRLLCWMVHSRSDYGHLAMESADRPSPDALSQSTFLGLVEEELRRR